MTSLDTIDILDGYFQDPAALFTVRPVREILSKHLQITTHKIII